jgi:hypothetical protein
VKLAAVEPAATVIVAGTVSCVALLERAIVAPLVGAAFDKVTEHAAVSPWFKLAGEQERTVTVVFVVSAIDAEEELPL